MNNAKEAGFTLIELLVTIVVATVFLTSAFLLVTTVSSLSNSGSQTTIANNLAYSNLREYANGRTPSWFVCNPSSPTTPVVLINDSSAVSRLPNPVLQYVTATAPYGCGGTSSGLPIRVESSVTFGSDSRKVTHASYVSY